MKERKYVIENLSVSLFLIVTLLILGPIEIFASNSAEFTFAFKDFWMAQSVFALVVGAIVAIVLTLLPKVVWQYVHTICFSFSVCCYIQAMFLNGKMESFLSQEINWSASTKIVNLLVWIAIVVILVAVALKNRECHRYIAIIAICLFFVQIVAFISLLISTPLIHEDKNGYISIEGMTELGKEENVVVFILDTYDERYVRTTLEQQPDIWDEFEGFVYYPNATSVHSRTYPSVPYLLTGDVCHYDKTPTEYLNEAYSNGNVISSLAEQGIDVGYYGYNYFLGDNVKSQVSNYRSESPNLNNRKVCKYLLKMTLYRDMPYIFKSRFEYDADDINIEVRTREEKGKYDYESDEFRIFDDTWFGEQIKGSIKISDDLNRAFRFYHLGSCHRNLSDPIPCGIESFEIISDYIKQMKELGVYDNSTIIITADHGFSGGGVVDDTLPQKTAVPLMLVKQKGFNNQSVIVSEMPVSHVDISPTIMDGFSLLYDEGNEPVYSVVNRDRIRHYYYTSMVDDMSGEIALKEYEISGDARDEKNYVYTGNEWPVYYSMNTVADK